MTEAMGCSHATGRRPCAAFALIALVLLSLSCQKTLAPLVASSHLMLQSDLREGSSKAYSYVAEASSGDSDIPIPRKIIRNGSLELLVSDVAQSITKIGSIVTEAGGHVEKSIQTNSGGHSANLTVRIPTARLDQVIAEIKRLATTVDRESVEVRDVTHEYIDLDARLRNAQAEEAQFLQILKRATTIKDTLDVTERLGDVRGRIEKMQGEMKFLTTQIDMSALEISLVADSDVAVAGIRWRPLRQAKIAVGGMVSGLADWADSVIAFLINLPLIAVWLISIVILVLVALRILRFLWRKFGPQTNWRFRWRRSAARDDAPASQERGEVG